MEIPEIDDSIPEIIANDFREAFLCYSVEAYNACAVMCRRAIETIALDKKAKGNYLYEKIKNLEHQGLHPTLIELATEIRMLGNVPAAHPDVTSSLRRVTREECEYLLDFLSECLNSIYVRPLRIRNLQNRRNN